jgi:hypothetical protein
VGLLDRVDQRGGLGGAGILARGLDGDADDLEAVLAREVRECVVEGDKTATRSRD